MDSSSVKVRIPAGVSTGSKLRSAGKGEAGQMGGQSGDLYIMIHVKEHELFERHDNDLFCEVPIKFTLAALGGSISVPTLFGKGSLKIPVGTQSGTTFRLKEQGVPALRGGRKGDLLIRVQVEVPTKLSSEQAAKLEDYAEACGDPATPSVSPSSKSQEVFPVISLCTVSCFSNINALSNRHSRLRSWHERRGAPQVRIEKKLGVAKIAAVISDHEDAGILALDRNTKCQRSSSTQAARAHDLTDEAEQVYIERIQSFSPKLIVLAGFMRIIKRLH